MKFRFTRSGAGRVLGSLRVSPAFPTPPARPLNPGFPHQSTDTLRARPLPSSSQFGMQTRPTVNSPVLVPDPHDHFPKRFVPASPVRGWAFQPGVVPTGGETQRAAHHPNRKPGPVRLHEFESLPGIESLSLGSTPQAPEPEPAVVTVSAQQLPLDKISASVSVISRSDIEASQAETIVELLQHTPFVYVSQIAGRGGLSTASIRGGDANFTLIREEIGNHRLDVAVFVSEGKIGSGLPV